MKSVTLIALLCLALPSAGRAQADSSVAFRNDSLSIRFSNADLRLAIQVLGRYLDRPVLFGNLGEVRITLETPQPVPRRALPELLRGLLRTYGLELTADSAFYTVGSPAPAAPVPAESARPAVQLFVMHLRHARAADVAATVNALYGQSSALGESGRQTPTLSDALRNNLVPPAEAAPPGAAQPVVPQAAVLTGEVTIIPDSRTNNLLVRATRADVDLIQAAVEELDVRPLQVLIEVVIAEVRRDRSLSFGVDAVLSGSDGSASTSGLGVGDFILTVMKLGAVDLTATLRAASSRGDVTILSRPALLAANNESAEILVGSQRPFIQVQRALPTDAPIRDQVVQFKDVGTRLTVRPTISDDGYVMLQVSQEVNAATAEVAFDAPVISTRTIQTQLLVRDGHTAVLGGLADQQKDITRGGIPVLSAIPLIGGLFGREVRRSTETELYVFLTPRVIRTDADLDDASATAGNRTRPLRGSDPTAGARPDSTTLRRSPR